MNSFACLFIVITIFFFNTIENFLFCILTELINSHFTFLSEIIMPLLATPIRLFFNQLTFS